MNTDVLRKKLKEGLNCSQTLLLYFAERYGLDRRQAKAIAEAFGGGMAQGDICGAVTGAYMVLGLEYGSAGEDSRSRMQEKVREFNHAFEEKMGSLQCEKLLGINISSDENFSRAMEEGLIERVCPQAIMAAIEILENMMGE